MMIVVVRLVMQMRLSLLNLLSRTAYMRMLLVDLAVLWLMCLLVVLIVMMVDVYISRRRASDRDSCRGMHQPDLEGSSL